MKFVFVLFIILALYIGSPVEKFFIYPDIFKLHTIFIVNIIDINFILLFCYSNYHSKIKTIIFKFTNYNFLK